MSKFLECKLLIPVRASPTVHLLEINRTPRLYIIYKMAEVVISAKREKLLTLCHCCEFVPGKLISTSRYVYELEYSCAGVAAPHSSRSFVLNTLNTALQYSTLLSLHSIPFHYTTSCYIALHYITLHYITLHYITLQIQYTTLQQHISLNVTIFRKP